MIKTLASILKDNWQWRRQIISLARIDILKTCRGAALGIAWLLIKPITYIACFWFALEIGLKAGSSTGYPYIIWLTSGLMVWFFVQKILGTGSNIYKRYSFLVNKIKFPISTISSFYVLSQLMIHIFTMLILLVLIIALSYEVPITALQIPALMFLMFLFFNLFSMLTSPLSAVSKDFSNLLKALSTPIFWLSGILFDVTSIGIDWIQLVLAYNPVTFFATSYRLAICDGVWLWQRPDLLIPFFLVFLVTLVCALWSQRRWSREVGDVL